MGLNVDGLPIGFWAEVKFNYKLNWRQGRRDLCAFVEYLE